MLQSSARLLTNRKAELSSGDKTVIKVTIPGRGELSLTTLVLDLNGTITVDGVHIDNVAERLIHLKDLDIWCVTADTLGTAEKLSSMLGIGIHQLDSGHEQEQKQAFIEKIGAENCIAIGNGANDVLMLQTAAIGICVIGKEGAASAAVNSADIVVTDINNALDLLLKTQRLIATLRS